MYIAHILSVVAMSEPQNSWVYDHTSTPSLSYKMELASIAPKRRSVVSEETKEKNRKRERDRNRANPEANRKRAREWAENNKQRKKDTDKKYYENNTQRLKDGMKLYSQLNRKSLNESARKREAWRRENDIVFVITKRMRARLGAFTRMKRTPKSGHTFDLISKTPDELVHHLENQLEEGEDLQTMQTDHIFPLSGYDIREDTSQLMAMHFSNLQPLTRVENKLKSDFLPTKAMAAKVERWAWPPGITEDMLPDIYEGWSTPLRM